MRRGSVFVVLLACAALFGLVACDPQAPPDNPVATIGAPPADVVAAEPAVAEKVVAAPVMTAIEVAFVECKAALAECNGAAPAPSVIADDAAKAHSLPPSITLYVTNETGNPDTPADYFMLDTGILNEHAGRVIAAFYNEVAAHSLYQANAPGAVPAITLSKMQGAIVVFTSPGGQGYSPCSGCTLATLLSTYSGTAIEQWSSDDA